jgi:hypothetical protein
MHILGDKQTHSTKYSYHHACIFFIQNLCPSKILQRHTLKSSQCSTQHLHTSLVGFHYSSSPSPFVFSAWKE